jgi:hypothetical protein
MPGRGLKYYCSIGNDYVKISDLKAKNLIQYIQPIELNEDNSDILTDRKNYLILVDERFVKFENNNFTLDGKVIPLHIAYQIGGVHIVKKYNGNF